MPKPQQTKDARIIAYDITITCEVSPDLFPKATNNTVREVVKVKNYYAHDPEKFHKRASDVLEFIQGKGIKAYMHPVHEALELDYSQISDVDVDGIAHFDAPDYVDAFICGATYFGREMDDLELETLNEDRDFVYEQVCELVQGE